jgi:hypothetical protein
MRIQYRAALSTALIIVLWAGTEVVRAQTAAQEEQALLKALASVKATLESGIAAAQAPGTPISAKFEMHENALQLSVYTMKGTGYSEVVVDYKTGKIAKAEPITEGEDLVAAKRQAAAVSKATIPLRTAVETAVKANVGYRAVSAMPEMKAGHPVAAIKLAKGMMVKTVSQKMD